MIHRELELLIEPMRELISKLIAACQEHGIEVYVFETRRDDDVQKAYCAQGREPLDVVNALRVRAKLYLLTPAENKMKITDDPPSGLQTVYKGVGHGNGTAADLVPMKGKDLWWNAPPEIWEKMGEIGEGLGLVWGGRWKMRDLPHFQMPRKQEN